MSTCLWRYRAHRNSKIYRFRLKCDWRKICTSTVVFEYGESGSLDCWGGPNFMGAYLNKFVKRHIDCANIWSLLRITVSFRGWCFAYISLAITGNWVFYLAEKYHWDKIAVGRKSIPSRARTGEERADEGEGSGEEAKIWFEIFKKERSNNKLV